MKRVFFFHLNIQHAAKRQNCVNIHTEAHGTDLVFFAPYFTLLLIDIEAIYVFARCICKIFTEIKWE